MGIAKKMTSLAVSNSKQMLNIDYNNKDAVTIFNATFSQELQSGSRYLFEEQDDLPQYSGQTDT